MPFSFLYKILFVFIQIITGVELPCEAKVGKRFIIEHAGCIVVKGRGENLYETTSGYIVLDVLLPDKEILDDI